MKMSKEQQSVLAIAAGLLLIAWLKHSTVFLITALLIVCALPFRSLNAPVHKAWMGLSKILGTISSHCILFILFYLFLTPISLLRKLARKKDFMKDFPGRGPSSFHLRIHTYDSKDFLNPW